MATHVWALVAGHWSAWQAPRVEVEQEREVEKEKVNPLEHRVADEVLARSR